MRPPTRTDGPVQSFRKHPPPSQPPAPATSISSPSQAPMSLAKGPLSSVTTAAAATRNDRGRRAFFNVESEQLLCCAAPTATALAHVPLADKAVAVPYDRRIDCDDVPDDFSTQVSFCSGPPSAKTAAPVNAATTASDDVPSLSANNRVVCADDEPPLWQARRVPNERRANSSASARSDGQPQRDLSDRVALVKNSASLIFTKKTAPAPLKQQQQQPAVHRRQRDAGRVTTTENRRSLHEHQQQTGVAAAAAARHERAYSWYAPLYTPLREEGGRGGGGEYRLLQSTASPHRESPTSSPHVAHRLAASEAHHPSESESLLEPQPPRATVGRASGAIPPNTLHLKFQNTPATAASNTVRPPQADHLLKQQQQQQRHFSMSPHGAEVQMAPVAAVAAPVTVVTPTPKYSRFEQLIKSLVGRKVSKGDTNAAAPAAPATTNTASIGSSDATGATDTPMAPSRASLVTPTPMALNYALSTPINHAAGHYPLLPSPEIRITKSPSEYSLLGGGGGGASTDRAHMSSTASLNAAVQQRLWSVVPLLTRRETAGGSCASLSQSSANIGAIGGRAALMKKCETVLALSRSSSSRHILEPAMAAASATATAIVRPQNRLRHSSSSTITCSRCSSLLSLAANGSRYSLNVSQGGGFVSIAGGADACDGSSVLSTPTPTAAAGCSRDSLLAAAGPMATTTTTAAATAAMASCKLCLGDVPANKLTVIAHCGCVFCTECMMAYVEFEILEGAYEISCPDALCPVQGALSIAEIARLSSSSLLDKHKRYRLNREVDLDKSRTWCPKAGCDTVCRVTSGTDRGGTPAGHDGGAVVSLQPISSSSLISSALNSGGGPCLVHCPTCTEQFCSGCKKTWHPSMSCEENTRRLAADGHADNIGIPFDNDLIKCCPTCSVPIEKDEGCAQMMCKRCKHVFCWYCLASLDDDFLLRHYDRGPCKNKLGHSRASVVWHRAQVIGIFAGFGILLLVASPLLLLAAPCIVCCKCRICSGAAKLEESGAEAEFEEFSALNR